MRPIPPDYPLPYGSGDRHGDGSGPDLAGRFAKACRGSSLAVGERHATGTVGTHQHRAVIGDPAMAKPRIPRLEKLTVEVSTRSFFAWHRYLISATR